MTTPGGGAPEPAASRGRLTPFALTSRRAFSAVIVLGIVVGLGVWACWPRSFDTPDVVGVVKAYDVVTSGVIDYTLTDGRQLRMTSRPDQGSFGVPEVGDLLISVTGRYFLSAQPRGPGGCYYLAGSGWDYGDWVGVAVVAGSTDINLRFPKAPGFVGTRLNDGDKLTNQLIGQGGLCVNSQGQATSYS